MGRRPGLAAQTGRAIPYGEKSPSRLSQKLGFLGPVRKRVALGCDSAARLAFAGLGWPCAFPICPPSSARSVETR